MGHETVTVSANDRAPQMLCNHSEYLSRHPHVSESSSREELVAEGYVNFIAAERVPKAMCYAEVLAATLDDPTLQCIEITSVRWSMVHA